jgi:uncharacterized protein
MAKIETPCIKVCIVQHASGLCIGCRRTLAEIAGWMSFSDAERSRIMLELPERVETILGQAADAVS